MWPLNEAAGRRQSPSSHFQWGVAGAQMLGWMSWLPSEVRSASLVWWLSRREPVNLPSVGFSSRAHGPALFLSGVGLLSGGWVVYRDKPARSVALATPVSRGVCCPSSHKLENYHCEIWAEISSERRVVQPDRGVEEQRWEVWWDTNLQTCWAQHKTPIRTFGSRSFGSKVKFYGIN